MGDVLCACRWSSLQRVYMLSQATVRPMVSTRVWRLPVAVMRLGTKTRECAAEGEVAVGANVCISSALVLPRRLYASKVRVTAEELAWALVLS